MGLDMYLDARHTSYKVNGDSPLRTSFMAARTAANIPSSQNLQYIKVQCEVAYWHKANAIHGWFVTECQNGIDECQESPTFSQEKLRELVTLCNRLLETRDVKQAELLLPPRAGFFFGPSNVTDRYWSDLENTVEQLTPLLDESRAHLEFSYHASW